MELLFGAFLGNFFVKALGKKFLYFAKFCEGMVRYSESRKVRLSLVR